MPTWRLTYRPVACPRAPLITDVVAEVQGEHERHHVFWTNVPVMNRPRRIIPHRVARRDRAGRPLRHDAGPACWGGVRVGPSGADRRG